jgi:hypothetical protein
MLSAQHTDIKHPVRLPCMSCQPNTQTQNTRYVYPVHAVSPTHRHKTTGTSTLYVLSAQHSDTKHLVRLPCTCCQPNTQTQNTRYVYTVCAVSPTLRNKTLGRSPLYVLWAQLTDKHISYVYTLFAVSPKLRHKTPSTSPVRVVSPPLRNKTPGKSPLYVLSAQHSKQNTRQVYPVRALSPTLDTKHPVRLPCTCSPPNTRQK